LHETGNIETIMATELVTPLDRETLSSEKDAKLDIYNYAARFDGIPEITRRVIKRGRKKIIEIDVVLAEQNIKVTGRGTQLQDAEIAAALKFKQEAEQYHAERGSQAIVIKDSTALTTDNAKTFFDFYKMVHPRARIEVTCDQAKEFKRHGSMPYQAKVLIDGNPYGKEVEMANKKKAEALAYLTAALQVKALEPDIYPRFLKANKSGNGEILKPISSIDMPIDEDCLLCMRQTLLDARKSGLPDEADELLSDEDSASTRSSYSRRSIPTSEVYLQNKRLASNLETYLQNPAYVEMRQKRSGLPMNQYKQKVLDMVSSHTYSIVIGATGSGKTTQVPQILLDEAISNGDGGSCNVVCTQPRRIAATSVARRVADERGERLQGTVGYHVRFDAKLPQPGGSITYCTTGILLQQLQHSPDEVMAGNTHLVIDEVHERDILIDFLLIILKKVMARRLADGKSVPKIILMSATMDTDLFGSYFNNAAQGSECPTLSVPGRTFPVKERYLDNILEDMKKSYPQSSLRILQSDTATRDYLQVDQNFSRMNPARADGSMAETEQPEDFVIDWKKERKVSAEGEAMISDDKEDALIPYGLAAATIAHICRTSSEGAILVFLPGLDEIVQVEKLLREARPLDINFYDASKYKVHMLHSSMPAGQTEVFNPVPSGCRKIILSTNIAETSVTIPDVQYVVDTGKLREKRYDQLRRITKLQCTWISKSNSKQRAGRAGRVQNGNYYALFSKARYESLRAIGLPEMLRTDLQEICLDIKAQAFKSPIREFLAEAIEPPAPSAVDYSVMNLQALDCLTDDEKITPLGRLLASLPIHPSLGKMIVLGIIFRCLDPMLVLGAAAEERNLFTNPLERRREAQEAKLSFVEGSASDHIATLKAVRQMRLVRSERNDYYMRDFGIQNFIHNGAFKNIDSTAKQIEDILVEAGLIPFTPPHSRIRNEYGDPLLNENSESIPLIKALVLAGHHPNLAVFGGGRTFRTVGERGTTLHPSSVNAPRERNHSSPPDLPYGTLYTYSTMAKSNDGNSLYLRETSECTPLMATLFGGKVRQSPTSSNILEMDNWLPFYVKSNQRQGAKTVVEFRKAMERLFCGTFSDLAKKRRQQDGGQVKYLADEKVREIFAEGLVEVLKRDVRAKDESAKRGLGARTLGEVTALGDSWRPTEWKERSGRQGRGRNRDGGSALLGSLLGAKY
jgi:ATP-dependent RNA helicase DHX36